MSAVASALILKDAVKSFGAIYALRGADLELRQGEVLALLGDNGAGKSTLIKILSGVHRPDSGSLTVQGKVIDWKNYNVAMARRCGIETVYQERSLGEKQPLWRNVFMGRPITNRLGLIDVKREKAETMMILRDVLGLKGAGLHPDSSVSTLSGGERQGLAIARAMYFNASIVILDEPTTALAVSEVEKVLAFVDKLRASGRSCIFSSHELGHVHRIADRFAIMEHGRIYCVLERKGLTLDALVEHLLESHVNGIENNGGHYDETL